ncbi:MAG: hypothetical protein VKP72_08920 [bacterium]|nr:hypothetical protein [bacterium]
MNPLNPITGGSPTTVRRAVPVRSAPDMTGTMALQGVSTRDTWQPTVPPPPPSQQPRMAVRRLQDFEDLAQVLVVGVGSPLLGGLGALAGFALGGPAGSAMGSLIGASVPGVAFGAYDIVTNLVERASGKVTDWRQARVGLGVLGLGPGMALLGTAVAGLIGGPTALAIGAIAGTALLPLVFAVGSQVGAWFRKSPPEETTPVPVPDPAPVIDPPPSTNPA